MKTDKRDAECLATQCFSVPYPQCVVGIPKPTLEPLAQDGFSRGDRQNPLAVIQPNPDRSHRKTMITENEATKLWLSLHQVLEHWIDEIQNEAEINLPYLGENSIAGMTDAALAVLRSLDDVQISLKSDNMLTEFPIDET